MGYRQGERKINNGSITDISGRRRGSAGGKGGTLFLLLFVKEIKTRGKGQKTWRPGWRIIGVGWAKHGEILVKKDTGGQKEYREGILEKLGRCCVSQACEKKAQRAEQGNWSSKEPAEARQGEKRDRQSTGQVEEAGGQNQSPREKEMEGRGARARRWG